MNAVAEKKFCGCAAPRQLRLRLVKANSLRVSQPFLSNRISGQAIGDPAIQFE